MQPLLQVSNVQCRYDDKVILESVTFALRQGEIACLLGPSGCGKTTLLHAIAGFRPLAAGSIALAGRELSTAGACVPPEKRALGVVFQDYALFPHLTLEQNVAFGLKMLSRSERQSRIRELLQLVQLQDYTGHYPHQLSGGQQQRVALARALAPRPRLLLMDEPFSNLDTELRRSLAAEVREILREEGTAAILVTHDRGEAFVAGDKLGVLNEGRLQQWESPENIYRNPANAAVARVVGDGNLLVGRLLQPNLVETELGQVPLAKGIGAEGAAVEVFVRSENIVAGEHAAAVKARVLQKSFLGDSALYRFRLPSGREIEATLNAQLPFSVGSEVPLRIESPLVFESTRD